MDCLIENAITGDKLRVIAVIPCYNVAEVVGKDRQ